MTNTEKDEFLKKEARDLQKISFGNMIKCHFNDHGEIIGFDIR